jgi:hypothetical protein
VFPNSISRPYAFIEAVGYVPQDTLQYGLGYWLKFSAREDVVVPGVFRNVDSVRVRAGWNFIGTISHSVPANTIQQIPPAIVLSPYYGNNGYQPVDTLRPGLGYWVKVSQTGRLILR